MLPGSNSSTESGSGLRVMSQHSQPFSSQNQQQQNQLQSFVDTSPYFEDLNASFKLLFKSIQSKREMFETGFNNTLVATSSSSLSNQNQNGELTSHNKNDLNTNNPFLNMNILNTNGKNKKK